MVKGREVCSQDMVDISHDEAYRVGVSRRAPGPYAAIRMRDLDIREQIALYQSFVCISRPVFAETVCGSLFSTPSWFSWLDEWKHNGIRVTSYPEPGITSERFAP